MWFLAFYNTDMGRKKADGMGEKKYGKRRKGNINSKGRNEDGKDMVKREN